ncbi:hypothetical protein G7Z17_g7298 [Cylindrodendrum hubeiense]|uniref:Uncharacterized protein n=1 Tax=Cylindrodendrum hubeiense TaxID=595255 RepID=A0A9P5H5S3_9HYPO|nr:hypothetical protein G7Z17_g7298 [Cylindrodendrum hubeiense]
MDPDVETAPQEGPSNNADKGHDEVKIEELSSEKADLEIKLADEMNLRRFTENVLDSRQQELESQEATLKKELADTQRQLTEARNQTKSKNKQLQDARDQIFRLQPLRNDITEAEAREAYKNLCGNVQRWAENRLKGALEDLDHGRLKTRPAPPQAARFVGLIREPSRRCLSVDQSDEYHVVGVIMNYLWLVLFSKSFYCPLDDSDSDGTVRWIDELENVAHCREWRSETLTALTNQPNFKTRRARHLNLVTDDLTSLLSIFTPKTPPAELHASVRRNIIDPAADLVHRLHLASSFFSLKWPARTAPSRLEVYECLNLASGGLILDLAGTNKDSPSRSDVSYLFDVCPGLFVERVEGGKKLALRAISKPTVLVNKGDAAVPQKPTLVKWLCDSAGSAQSSVRGPVRTAGPKSKPGYPGYLSKL